jgi:outer membrane immunogenic protein
MKLSLLAGVSLSAIALAGGVQAADLGPRPVYKAPALAPAVWNWTGFYVGANVGAAFDRSSIADDPSTSTAWLNNVTYANDETSIIGGLQAGYNWQWDKLVLGVEGDISATSFNRSSAVTRIGSVTDNTYSSQLTWLGTIRGRLGWAFDRTLIYGTGGVAFANLKDQLSDPNLPFTAAPSSGRTGWAAGGGIEHAFADHWTAKVEYLHVGFGDRTATDTSGNGYVFKFKDSLDIGRVGINYKF